MTTSKATMRNGANVTETNNTQTTCKHATNLKTELRDHAPCVIGRVTRLKEAGQRHAVSNIIIQVEEKVSCEPLCTGGPSSSHRTCDNDTSVQSTSCQGQRAMEVTACLVATPQDEWLLFRRCEAGGRWTWARTGQHQLVAVIAREHHDDATGATHRHHSWVRRALDTERKIVLDADTRTEVPPEASSRAWEGAHHLVW